MQRHRMENMIKKIDHINISVTDLEISKRFYIDLLGFELEKEGELEGEWIDRVVGLEDVKAKYSKLILPGAETCMELIQYYHPLGDKDPKRGVSNQIGFRHIAFEVENIEKVYGRLKHAGVKMFSELQVYNEGKKLCYFAGPDEVILELAEYS